MIVPRKSSHTRAQARSHTPHTHTQDAHTHITSTQNLLRYLTRKEKTETTAMLQYRKVLSRRTSFFSVKFLSNKRKKSRVTIKE